MTQHTVLNASIDYILNNFTKGNLRVPEYQRSPEAWDRDPFMRSRLIETIYMGLPIPPMWITGSLLSGEIIDALQRLTTMRMFRNNELRLKGLEYLKDLNGKRYYDLSDTERLVFDSYSLAYFQLPENTPHGNEIGPMMFTRLNFGMSLKHTELSDGQNLGVGRDLLHDLSVLLGEYLNKSRWNTLKSRKHDLAYTVSAVVGLCGEYRAYTKNGDPEWGVWGIPMRSSGTNPAKHLEEATYKALNAMTSGERADLRNRFASALPRLKGALGEALMQKIRSAGNKYNHSLTRLHFASVPILKKPESWWVDNSQVLREVFLKVDDVRPDRKIFEKSYVLLKKELEAIA